MPNLTAASYVVIAVICLLGIIGQWTMSPLPFWQVAAAAYLAGLTYEWIRVRETSIAAAVTSDLKLRLGRPAELTITFTNPTPLTQSIVFATDLPPAIEASPAERRIQIAGASTADASVSVLPVDVGRYSWSSLPMRVRGPLALGWWRYRSGLRAELEVIPDLLAAPERAAGLAQSGSAARQRIGTGRELHHLRAYRPGDPRHTIDWKATARSGELITRVFGEDQHLEIILIVDAGRTSRTRIDGLSQLGHYINLSARFAEHAIANEDQIGLIAVTDRPVAIVPPGRGLAVIQRLRGELGRIATEAVETDLLAAAREMARFVRHRAMIVVLTDLYGATGPGRLSQCVRMWVPQHLPVVVGMVGSELQQLADQTSREWLDPYVSLAARTYQADLHRGMRGLRQLGAHTVLAKPRDLESRVFSHYHQLKAQRRI